VAFRFQREPINVHSIPPSKSAFSSPPYHLIDFSRWQSATDDHQARTGPTRTKLIQPVRSQPYRPRPFRPWETEHVNVERGPLTTEPIQPRRSRLQRPGPFRPWETETEHTNAEGDLPTLPPFSSFDWTWAVVTDCPPEGYMVGGPTKSERREENKEPVSNFYHSRIPRSYE
jgi:hypothetical protein